MKIGMIAVVLMVAFGLMPFAGFAHAADAPSHLQTAKQRYLQAKQQYLNAKEAYVNAKQQYLTAKQAYQTRKNESELRPVVKDFLGKSLDAIIRNLERLQAHVNETNAAEIADWIEYLEAKKLELENATTKQQLIDIAKDLHTKWVSHRRDLKRMVGQAVNQKVIGVINNANGLAKKVNNTIQNLKALGVDTAELETLLADFQSKISLATEKYEAAKQKYREAQTAAEVDQLLQQGHQYLKDAHAYLKQAHQKLRELVKSLKQKSGELPLPEEAPPTPANETVNQTANQTNTT